jgi:taurine transport system ATP-binding protein
MSRICFEQVSVKYPATQRSAEVLALQDINLTLDPGEFVVVIGTSGCGKTTLLNLLAGFIAPSSGQVTIDGRPVTGPGVDRGVVFQKNALMPWLNVSQNVGLGLKLQKMPRAERQQNIAKYLDWVGLEAFPRHQIYELSGGMRQRVGIARALASDPDILLMDEPLGALDAMTRESIQELVLRIWQKSHKQIFFITHSIEEALFMGTRLVVMTPRPGRISKSYRIDFSRQFLEHGNARKIKASADFIALREEILELIHPQEASHV